MLPNDAHLSSITEISSAPRVAYIWSNELQVAADALPANLGRSTMVHNLIRSLDLLDDGSQPAEKDLTECEASSGTTAIVRKALVVPPDRELGSYRALQRYHDTKYVGGCSNNTRSGDLHPPPHPDKKLIIF
jgi:hypothetical protein